MELQQRKFEDLKHVRRPLREGGKVVVLDTGALITPEAEAMIQALHSRSIGGIDAHLVKLAQKGAKNFMDTYYVGYGDKSIGDCGTGTIFIEGVSMLVAKAAQDSMLYNGQESSTRFIDFSNQRFLNPHGSMRGRDLLEGLRNFHLEGLQIMKEELSLRHPRELTEDEKIWQKAINARAFDVMRSFLPAGAATNLAWHTELRHAADHLLRLRNHPLLEVREVAKAVHDALDEMFPSSFKQKIYEDTEEYTRKWMEDYYYFDFVSGIKADDVFERIMSGVMLEQDSIDYRLLSGYSDILSNRPRIKAEPPKFLAECGTMRFSFLLDFGSFRDIQRHRAIVQRMPLLTDTWGFHDWYLDQMPLSLASKARSFLKDYKYQLESLNADAFTKQYYLPMGYRVACRITGDIPALIWLAELRSGLSVHPTLRKIAHDIVKMMEERLGPYGLKLYVDNQPDRFNIKRGTHDIVEKDVK